MLTPVDPQTKEQESGSTTHSGRIFRDDPQFALGRIAVFQYATVAIFLFLLANFWILQIRDHETATVLAERNRIKTVPVPAPRGRILDRDMRVVVDNRASFTVIVSQDNLVREHLPAIAEGLHLDLQELLARVERYTKGPKYLPIPIKDELTEAELTFVESHRDPYSFPELEIMQAQKRLYPHDGQAAHVVGYVGEVSEQELNNLEYAKHGQGDIVGKDGLERQYNDLLTGIDGQRRVMVDSLQRERQVLESKEATPGQDLQLTLDLDLQSVAELAMDGRRGAVVAIDPRNGEVLAMVSRPAFDPNAFTSTLSPAYWNSLVTDPNTPMMNRAIQAQFAPGSTFKPIVAIAGLETGEIDDQETMFCSGGATFYGRYTKCHKRHDEVDLHRAMVQSCDVFFYNLGDRLKIDNIAKYAVMAGIGEKTGVDLPGEASGLMPSTTWKMRTQRARWYPGETISVAIGQGAVTVTPLQLAVAIAGLVTGGNWYQPHMVKQSGRPEPIRTGRLDHRNIQTIVDGMYGVVNEGGTGASAMIPGISVSGKTGSAQRVSNDFVRNNKDLAEDFQDNGWFVGFAPRDNPEIVVVTLLEAGLHGSGAAPISRDVIKAYFDKKARRPQMTPLDMARNLLLPVMDYRSRQGNF